VVALQADLKDRPVVALMTPDKPSVVLSKPAAAQRRHQPLLAARLWWTRSRPRRAGSSLVSGRSSPRASGQASISNDSYQASTTAAANGRFAFTTMNEGIRPGKRFIGSGWMRWTPVSGAIRSRAEVPFEAASAASAGLPAAGLAHRRDDPKGSTAIVSRGDSLWRISRAA